MSGAFTVAVEGAVLSGERCGEGTPLVFVHGMASDRHEWDRLIAALPANIAAFTYDLRGFGLSKAQDGMPFSHADDLLALFDARGIERATLVGLSMGGAIALNFALGNPWRVARLVLISPHMVGWEASEDWKGLWHGVTRAARAGDMATARRLWLEHPMFDALREHPGLTEELRTSLDGYHGSQWVRDCQRDELPDIDRLHGLAMPCLLLTGERDHPDLRLIAGLIEAAAPNVRRIDYAGTGHRVHAERTGEVARAIAEFIA
jgi:pimeloyl-ACP methyl ester carboxylesterase